MRGIVEFGATDEYPPIPEAFMETGEGESGAIGGNHQILLRETVQRRDEAELYRPSQVVGGFSMGTGGEVFVHKVDCSLGTGWNAAPQPVAERCFHHPGFSIAQRNDSFMAGQHTLTATGTFGFLYFNGFDSWHSSTPFLFRYYNT